MPTPEDLIVVAPIPSDVFPGLPVGTDLTGAFLSVSFKLGDGTGVSYPATIEDVKAHIAPNDIVRNVAPFGVEQMTEPGKPGQRYWHKRPNNAITLYQYDKTKSNPWVLVHAWGASATDAVPNQLPVITLVGSKNALTVGEEVTLNASAYDPDGNIVVVEFFQGSQQIGRATSAPYALTIKPSAAGGFSYTARATDNSGAASVSTPLNIAVVAAGLVPATIVLNVPVTVLAVNQPLPLTAIVTQGTYPVEEVSFYDGSVPLATLTTTPYAFEWKPTTPGNHALTARVLDEDGNSVVSAVVNISVTATTSQNTITTSLSANSVTAGEEVVLKANAAAPAFGVEEVEFLIDGQSVGLKTVKEASGLYELSYRPTTAGVKTFVARLLDGDGFTTVSTSKQLTVAAVAGNQPPTVTSFTASATALTTGQTLTFTASATDSDGTVALIRVREGSNVVASITGTSGTSGSITPTTGSHTYSARAVDNQGLEGPIFATTRTVSVTSTVTPAPVITSVSPSSGAIGTPITITGQNLTGVIGLAFNGATATVGTNSATSVGTTVPTGATTGNIALTTAGGTATVAFTVTTVVVPPTPPSFNTTLTGPSDEDNAGTGTLLSASANDLFKFNTKALGASDPKRMDLFLPNGTQVAAVDFLVPYVGDQFSFQMGGTGTIYYGVFADSNVTLSTAF